MGNDIPAFWENLLAGKNGIGPLSRFDAGEYKAKVAAQVKDFDPLRYMEKGEIRKSDLFCQYAMAAACQQWRTAAFLERWLRSGSGCILDPALAG